MESESSDDEEVEVKPSAGATKDEALNSKQQKRREKKLKKKQKKLEEKALNNPMALQ